MSWWKKVEKPFWAVLPAKNGNCHKSINIAQGTLIFGSSIKWVSRVIWPFQKIFCLLFKILRYRQILVKTSGSPQTISAPKICPFLSWIPFLCKNEVPHPFPRWGFVLLADWAPTAPPCSPFGSKGLFGTDTFPCFLYIKLYRAQIFVWDRHLFGTDICLGQTYLIFGKMF